MLKSALAAKRFDYVRKHCERLLAKHARHVGLLSLAASAAYGQRDLAAAENFLQRALALRPDSKTLQENLKRVRAARRSE